MFMFKSWFEHSLAIVKETCMSSFTYLDVTRHIFQEEHLNNRKGIFTRQTMKILENITEQDCKLLVNNGIVCKKNEFKCLYCLCNIPCIASVFDHINGKHHETFNRNSKKINSNEKSNAVTISDNPNANSLPRIENTFDEINRNAELMSDDRSDSEEQLIEVYYCELCNLQVNAKDLFDHVETESHLTVANQKGIIDKDNYLLFKDCVFNCILCRCIHLSNSNHKNNASIFMNEQFNKSSINNYTEELQGKLELEREKVRENSNTSDQLCDKISFSCISCKKIIQGNKSFIEHIQHKEHKLYTIDFLKRYINGNYMDKQKILKITCAEGIPLCNLICFIDKTIVDFEEKPFIRISVPSSILKLDVSSKTLEERYLFHCSLCYKKKNRFHSMYGCSWHFQGKKHICNFKKICKDKKCDTRLNVQVAKSSEMKEVNSQNIFMNINGGKKACAELLSIKATDSDNDINISNDDERCFLNEQKLHETIAINQSEFNKSFTDLPEDKQLNVANTLVEQINDMDSPELLFDNADVSNPVKEMTGSLSSVSNNHIIKDSLRSRMLFSCTVCQSEIKGAYQFIKHLSTPMHNAGKLITYDAETKKCAEVYTTAENSEICYFTKKNIIRLPCYLVVKGHAELSVVKIPYIYFHLDINTTCEENRFQAKQLTCQYTCALCTTVKAGNKSKFLKHLYSKEHVGQLERICRKVWKEFNNIEKRISKKLDKQKSLSSGYINHMEEEKTNTIKDILNEKFTLYMKNNTSVTSHNKILVACISCKAIMLQVEALRHFKNGKHKMNTLKFLQRYIDEEYTNQNSIDKICRGGGGIELFYLIWSDKKTARICVKPLMCVNLTIKFVHLGITTNQQCRFCCLLCDNEKIPFNYCTMARHMSRKQHCKNIMKIHNSSTWFNQVSDDKVSNDEVDKEPMTMKEVSLNNSSQTENKNNEIISLRPAIDKEYTNDLVTPKSHKYIVQNDELEITKISKCKKLLLNYAEIVDNLFQCSEKILACDYHDLYVLLEKSLTPLFDRKIKLHFFGSRINGLGTVDSDIDIFVDCDSYCGNTMDNVDIMKNVENKLMENKDEWKVRRLILTARTPIIKCWYKKMKLECDISFKHGLSVENTYLIRTYNLQYPNCRKLNLFLKKWLSSCYLSKSSNYLSNYGLAWKVIFYLQQRKIVYPVTKLLEQQSIFQQISDWRACSTYNVNVINIETSDTLRDLLVGFFKYYGEFDYKRDVICPLTGELLNKADFVQLETLPKEMDLYVKYINTTKRKSVECFRINSAMCVQDPYELSHNITRAVSPFIVKRFKKCCKKSAEFLENS